jgi:lipopolysaccharide biosynthesis glycosyltransferase
MRLVPKKFSSIQYKHTLARIREKQSNRCVVFVVSHSTSIMTRIRTNNNNNNNHRHYHSPAVHQRHQPAAATTTTTTTTKYNILVPLEDPPSPLSSSSSSHKQISKGIGKLPWHLRMLLYICILNFGWLVLFSHRILRNDDNNNNNNNHHHHPIAAVESNRIDEAAKVGATVEVEGDDAGLHDKFHVLPPRVLRHIPTTTAQTKTDNNETTTLQRKQPQENTNNNNNNNTTILVVIVSNRLSGVIPTVASILQNTKSKPVRLVLIGDHFDINDDIQTRFGNRLHDFTALTLQDVQDDLQAQGYKPIWTWPQWGTSRNDHWNNDNTIHRASWDDLETHAHPLNHLRFYLPYLRSLGSAKYLYFLDDDILVQRDLGHIADQTLANLHPSKGIVTPCNIWIWNSECHHFEFRDETNIESIFQMPSLYGDRPVCKSESESHCVPDSYQTFLETVVRNGHNQTGVAQSQKGWNFGFSLFALDNWKRLQLTQSYESVMKANYQTHVFPETTLTFGLGIPYLAFAGAVECWNDQQVKVRDGFGFVEWDRYEKEFGKDFMNTIDVVHYTGPHKPWDHNTPIDARSLDPWLNSMRAENMEIPRQLSEKPATQLFTVLAGDRTGGHWIMSALDRHPQICATGEAKRAESGFPVDVLLPSDMPWLPLCSQKRGCGYAFLRDKAMEMAETMDLRMRTGKLPMRCQHPNQQDPLGKHLPRVCNFLQALNHNFTRGNIERVWVDAFRAEDNNLLGCSCPRGSKVKGLKVLSEWLVHKNFPGPSTGPPDLVLGESALVNSKVIRLKRRNLWARYKSSVLARESDMYHVSSLTEKHAQLAKVSSVAIDLEEMLDRMDQYIMLDEAGDDWASENASDTLWLFYEDCRDDMKNCMEKIFAFLGVDTTQMPDNFESEFASLRDMDASLDHITNKGSVIEALSNNGYGHFVNVSNTTEIQLLVYDESEALDRTHQFHRVKGVNVTVFGRYTTLSRKKKYPSKFHAAVPILQGMDPETLVVLSDNIDVRMNFPPGQDSLRYESIFNFRVAFEELTRFYSGSVVASTESYCCASSLTHAKPGDFFMLNGHRRKRACTSGEEGCKWAGDEMAKPWQSFMEELAAERSKVPTDNPYLDASLIAGKAVDLLAFVQATDIGSGEDDRAVLTDYLFRNPDAIVLDYEQKLFGENRQGLHSQTNRGCTMSRPTEVASRILKRTSTALFMHSQRKLGCGTSSIVNPEQDIFPRWDDHGIDIQPILDHIDRVARQESTIVLPEKYGGRIDYSQGPEIPYFVDENAVWTSKLIRDRTDSATLEWRTKPTEELLKMALKILKLDDEEVELRWSALRHTVRSGGFPFWAWYGDFKTCNKFNHGNESIPVLTPAVRADCDHAFPMPNYMNIINSQATTDNWRGLFRDAEQSYPWYKKIRKVVWRGSLSEADRESILTSVRWRANKLIHKLNSNLYDVGITSIPPWVAEKASGLDISKAGGVVENITPMASFNRYLAVLDMDGNSWSSRFASLLCYSSVVIKVEPQYLEYFFADLKPWTHYIPVKADLSDLHENVQWALDPANDEVVKDIVTAANEWCSQRLIPQEMARDILDIWEAYVRLLDRADPHWRTKWMKKKSDILAATSDLDLFRLKNQILLLAM